jgi:hypothetical protein
MDLIPFAEVIDIQENRILEDAIFEILVTDELHRSLARLQTWDSAIPWSRKLVRLAEHGPADFLVDVTIRPWNRRWQVTFILYDVQARRPVRTKSFTEVSHDPVTVSQEIAKHVTRSLWQVQHQRSKGSQKVSD